jgi:hypothetical protein
MQIQLTAVEKRAQQLHPVLRQPCARLGEMDLTIPSKPGDRVARNQQQQQLS